MTRRYADFTKPHRHCTIGDVIAIFIAAAVLTIVIVCVLVAVISIAKPVKAHEAPSGWQYPYSCCGDHDCSPIPASRVKPEGAGGYVVDSKFHVARKDVLESPDGQYHACFPTSERMSCFYAPPNSY